jgi:hypothetical protein
VKATYHKACLERGETLALAGAPYLLALSGLATGSYACISARKAWSTRKPTVHRKDVRAAGRREKT